MSVYTSIKLFIVKPKHHSNEMMNKMLEFAKPDRLVGISRDPVYVWGEEENSDEEEFFQDIPLQKISSLYLKHKTLHASFYHSWIIAHVQAIMARLSPEIRGNMSPDSLGLMVGKHDIASSGEDKLLARVEASISISGYGSPANTNAFRELLNSDKEFQELLAEVSRNLGDAKWAVIVG